MRFVEEVVVVDGERQHRRQLPDIRVRLDRACKDNHVRIDLDILLVEKVNAVDMKLSVRKRCHLSDIALDVVNAILLDRSAVEFIKILSRRTDIDVEHMDVGVRIVILDQDCLLCCVHTADLGTVGLSSPVIRRASGADTLDEDHFLRLFVIGHPFKMAGCRTGCVHQSFKLDGGNDILAHTVSELAELVEIDHVKSGCNDNRTVFLLDDLILQLVVDCMGRADLGADSALSGLEMDAVFLVDDRDVRNRLCKRNIDSRSCIESSVEFIRSLSGRTLGCADPTACAVFSPYGTGMLCDLDCEVSDETRHIRHLRVCEDPDIRVLVDLCHPRSKNAG